MTIEYTVWRWSNKLQQTLLKTLRLAALRRLGSNLIHLITVDGKNSFEKVTLSMKWSNFICISGIVISNF